MIFGDKTDFAIEAFHEAISENETHVFGRMCCWCQGKPLGDLSEPSCMLDVTAGQIEDVLNRLEQLQLPEFKELTDQEIYDLLDSKIYIGEDDDPEKIVENSKKYFPFDFLSNGGESFDNSKSFIVTSCEKVRILFYDYGIESNVFTTVNRNIFESSITGFLAWYKKEKENLTNG